MRPSFIEVKSALWQKIFASVVLLPFVGLGLVCCASPFVPLISGPAPHPALAIAIGLFLGGCFFCFWWAIVRYSIRADDEGIEQFNGFFRQSVRWSQVESYYQEPNIRYYSERHHHIEPVLLNSDGKIIFQGFAHVMEPTNKIIEQRRQLWRFVESKLEGKQIEKPFTDLDAQQLAAQSLNDVGWSKKSWQWKLTRLISLIFYALFLLFLALAPGYYIIVNDVQISETARFLAVVWMMIMLMAPLLIYSIRVKLRERRIKREHAKKALE